MSQDCEVPGRPSVPNTRPTGVNFHDTVEVRSSNLKSRVTQLRLVLNPVKGRLK